MLKVHNKLYNTYPLVVHHPYMDSEQSLFWNQLLEAHNTINVTVPNDLTIVTWNSRPRQGCLEIQLDSLKVPYTLLGKGLNWKTNRLKSRTLLEEIDNIKTKYILGMDCFDAILVSTLEDIIQRFQNKNAKIVYNAATWLYPDVKNHRSIEEKICPNPPFQFLNGGLFIGETEYVKTMLANSPTDNKYSYSEQYILKLIYHNSEDVKLDWNCEIFQIIYLPKFFKLKIEDYVECI